MLTYILIFAGAFLLGAASSAVYIFVKARRARARLVAAMRDDLVATLNAMTAQMNATAMATFADGRSEVFGITPQDVRPDCQCPKCQTNRALADIERASKQPDDSVQ